MVAPKPAFQFLPVILITNVNPNAAGTVQFKDGDTNLGGPVRVFYGFAVHLVFGLAPGEHTLTAEFTPTDRARFGSSSDSEQVRVRDLFSLFRGLI